MCLFSLPQFQCSGSHPWPMKEEDSPACGAVLCACRVPSSPFRAAWGSLHWRWPGWPCWPPSLQCPAQIHHSVLPSQPAARARLFWGLTPLPLGHLWHGLAGSISWLKTYLCPDQAWGIPWWLRVPRRWQLVPGPPSLCPHLTRCALCGFCRGASLCRRVRLQVHRDLGSGAAQREGAVRGHRAAGPAPQGQQGKEREAPGAAEAEREHPQKSQALLGQNSCQEQQEHGLQTQVQVLPWPISTLRTLDFARACGILWTLSNFVIGQSINLY